MARNIRPMLRQYFLTELILFAECNGSKGTGPFKPKAEAANAGEKIEYPYLRSHTAAA